MPPASVHLVRLLGDPVLVEHEREGAEGGGLDRVDADREELVVHLGDDVGPGDVRGCSLQPSSAAPPKSSAVERRRPCTSGAERAVEDQDAFAQRAEEIGHDQSRLPEALALSIIDSAGTAAARGAGTTAVGP